MTTLTITAQAPATTRPKLVSRALLIRFVSIVGSSANVSATRMYDLVPESGYSAVSAVWNLAYDAGMGIGAAGFGVLAAQTGYPGGFFITAILLPVPLVLIARRNRWTKVR